MRRIAYWMTSTVAVVVLLFSYRTSTMGAGGSTRPAALANSGDAGTATSAPQSTATSTAIPPTSTSRSSKATAAPKSTTATTTPAAAVSVVKGQAVDTRWGPVQVAITVANAKIASVKVLQQPNGNQRDVEINSAAIPVLVQETLSAQSARIDGVSGASITSDGYIASLQSAIDAAHLS